MEKHNASIPETPTRQGLLTAAILSISLLTVMAGAAIAPALGIIKEHFAESPALLVQFVISLPALFIIITNLMFPTLCRWMRTRTLAIVGLTLYVVAGVAPYFCCSLGWVLVFRALLGISVGMIMPLSTGLLAYYFPPERQASLMGLSAAMNQMGGVVATLLAGLLATRGWNYAFLVYLLAIIAIILVISFLPNEDLSHPTTPTADNDDDPTLHMSFWQLIRRFHPSVIGMFLAMSLFFVYPSNFAITARQETALSNNTITLIMVGLDVVAFLVGLLFGRLMHLMPRQMKYVAPIFFMGGYAVLAFIEGVTALLVGSLLIGIANGIGIPYLNTIASIKGGHHAATTVMPIISAMLYLGQFLSPIYISQLGTALFGDTNAAYLMAIIVSVLFLLQTFVTRDFQRLPPRD